MSVCELERGINFFSLLIPISFSDMKFGEPGSFSGPEYGFVPRILPPPERSVKPNEAELDFGMRAGKGPCLFRYQFQALLQGNALSTPECRRG